MSAIRTPFAIRSARPWSQKYAYAPPAERAIPPAASRIPAAVHNRRCISLRVVLPLCVGAQSPGRLEARAHAVRGLPLGARLAGARARALPRGTRAGGVVPRRRRG